MTQLTRLPAVVESVTGPTADAGHLPEGAAVSPAGGTESGSPGAHSADDLRKFGSPDVLPKPFTLAETGRKLREKTRRDKEDAVQDDRWRDDGGQGHRLAS
jgi:hypothetical protein